MLFPEASKNHLSRAFRKLPAAFCLFLQKAPNYIFERVLNTPLFPVKVFREFCKRTFEHFG